MTVLKQAPLPEDILTLGVEGVNQIWRDAKMRVVGKKSAQALIEAARHSVGTKEGVIAARIEIRMLLEDYESRNNRLQEVMTLIEELVKQIPMAEKLMEIKGVGIKTVSGFLAEVGDISRFRTTLNPGRIKFSPRAKRWVPFFCWSAGKGCFIYWSFWLHRCYSVTSE